LQQDLLLAPQILDVEWGHGTVRQARAEVLRVEVVGSGNLDISQSPFDKAKSDHSVDHVLIGNDGPGVDVAAIDVEQRELATDLFEIGGGYCPMEGLISPIASSRTVVPVMSTPRRTKRGPPEAAGGLRRAVGPSNSMPG
jgi:hypothetical protein